MKFSEPLRRLFYSILNSKVIIILIVFIVFIRNLDLGYWRNPDRIINWDIISYYAYLPATFIYKDPTLEFLKNPDEDFSKKFWPVTSPIGKPVIMTTMGMSLLYSPFFFLAHLYTQFTEYKANGFTEPYKFFLIMSCVFYFSLGLIYLRKLLRFFFFKDKIISIVLLVITFGTNIWYYTSIEPTMAHTYLFALITIFAFLTHRWYKRPTIGLSVLLGLISGLVSLIRPTNIVIVLVFFFWGISSFPDIRERFLIYINKFYLIILIFLIAFIIWIPQIFYWKIQSGQYLFYSYGEINKFFFNNPHILSTLFSYRKGWLIYTPVMIFALAGYIFLWKYKRKFFWSIASCVIIHLYIISSWWCWWWGGSFGLRAMVDLYGILAIPLGMTIQVIFKSRISIRIPALILLYFLVFLSIFNTMQVKRNIIHWDSMTKKAYWAVFLSYKIPENYDSMLEIPDYEKARQGIQAIMEQK